MAAGTLSRKWQKNHFRRRVAAWQGLGEKGMFTGSN
jgi:hypothetical protein